jgi:hypothetical protein
MSREELISLLEKYGYKYIGSPGRSEFYPFSSPFTQSPPER